MRPTSHNRTVYASGAVAPSGYATAGTLCKINLEIYGLRRRKK
jgi:hypothetical protein